MNASLPADAVQDVRRPDPIVQFFRAPFQARSYTNLLYLLLSLPLGIFYFTLLATGLSLGTGLIITLLGLPIVGVTLVASWWLAALERRMAIGFLGAEIPPMGPKPFQSHQGIRRDLEDFLSNRVTWTGLLFLGFKLPLGIVSFVAVAVLVSLSMSFLLVPFLYPFSFIEWDGLMLWWVDTPTEAGLCFLVGLLFTYVSLLLLNGLAALWKGIATTMLGSARFEAPAVEAAPVEPEEPTGA